MGSRGLELLSFIYHEIDGASRSRGVKCKAVDVRSLKKCYTAWRQSRIWGVSTIVVRRRN